MIHTALEDFSVTGISPLHGVYIDYPELDGAYAFNDTFMFCNGIRGRWHTQARRKKGARCAVHR